MVAILFTTQYFANNSMWMLIAHNIICVVISFGYAIIIKFFLNKMAFIKSISHCEYDYTCIFHQSIAYYPTLHLNEHGEFKVRRHFLKFHYPCEI